MTEQLGRPPEPADLPNLPLISPEDYWWDHWFAAAGVEGPRPAAQGRPQARQPGRRGPCGDGRAGVRAADPGLLEERHQGRAAVPAVRADRDRGLPLLAVHRARAAQRAQDQAVPGMAAAAGRSGQGSAAGGGGLKISGCDGVEPFSAGRPSAGGWEGGRRRRGPACCPCAPKSAAGRRRSPSFLRRVNRSHAACSRRRNRIAMESAVPLRSGHHRHAGRACGPSLQFLLRREKRMKGGGVPSGDFEPGAKLGLAGQRVVEAGQLLVDQHDLTLRSVLRGFAFLFRAGAEILDIVRRHWSCPLCQREHDECLSVTDVPGTRSGMSFHYSPEPAEDSHGADSAGGRTGLSFVRFDVAVGHEMLPSTLVYKSFNGLNNLGYIDRAESNCSVGGSHNSCTSFGGERCCAVRLFHYHKLRAATCGGRLQR